MVTMGSLAVSILDVQRRPPAYLIFFKKVQTKGRMNCNVNYNLFDPCNITRLKCYEGCSKMFDLYSLLLSFVQRHFERHIIHHSKQLRTFTLIRCYINKYIYRPPHTVICFHAIEVYSFSNLNLSRRYLYGLKIKLHSNFIFVYI